MKITTWNVNSVRQRLDSLMVLLTEESPDIVLLQETKVMDDVFPRESIEDAGYNIVTYGQKTFNGVALLSKFSFEDVQRGLPPFLEDPQARYIEAFTGGVRVASVYVPNGQSVDSEKFSYKLKFLQALESHLELLQEYGEAVVIGGDFNITVNDLDVYDPLGWKDKVLCHPLEREALRKILHLGYTDSVRSCHPETPHYSWWDYRQQSFQRNLGLRIDHLLISPQALDRLQDAGVLKIFRGHERPSDHAPVWLTLL